MNLFSSEEVTHIKIRSIELVSALKIEPADGNRREKTCCPKTAAGTTLSIFILQKCMYM